MRTDQPVAEGLARADTSNGTCPLVSAVVVNWNGADHLRGALPTLIEQAYTQLEILVVDNGSTDDSRSVVAAHGASWIGLKINRGLSAALNIGAATATGEFLIFLNNDMRFPSDFVKRLVTPLNEDESLFATDARQLDWTGETQIHLATRLKRRSLVATYLRPGVIPLLDITQHQVTGLTREFQACSAAMAVRKTMFEALGGFDERLIVSWEDTDLCWRAWLQGWPTAFVPAAYCWHRVGGATQSREGALARIRGIVGGRLIFANKCLPSLYSANAWIVSILGLLRDLIHGRLSEAILKARTIWSVLGILPHLLAERRRLYREATLSPSSQLRRMLEFGQES